MPNKRRRAAEQAWEENKTECQAMMADREIFIRGFYAGCSSTCAKIKRPFDKTVNLCNTCNQGFLSCDGVPDIGTDGNVYKCNCYEKK